MVSSNYKQCEFGKYPDDWKLDRLGEHISILTDYHANGSYKKLKENVELLDEEDYAYMIRTTNFEQNAFEKSDFKYITESAYNFLEKTKVYQNDILMNKIANAGSVYLVPKLNKPISLAMNLFLIRMDNVNLDQKYSYYFMKNYEKYVKTRTEGSVTKTITKDNVKKLQIAYPSIQEQRKIVNVLEKIEEKIENNNKINKKLEEMAQAIFKHWFVDFEFPNEEGKPYKSSGGEMIESELGMIPKGWKVVELNEIGNLIMGLSPKSDSYNNIKKGTPLLNGAADFNGGLINPTKYTTQETRTCKSGDLVFCIRATIGNISFADKEYCLGRGVAAIQPKNIEYIGIIYMNLSRSIERLKAQASGSVILGLSKPDINNMKIVLPCNTKVNDFSKIFNDLNKQIQSLLIENKVLINLRDILLPKLMSGEIRVPLD